VGSSVTRWSAMTDQDRLDKIAFCDFLIKEGIDGQQDEAAVGRTATLTNLALELGREDCLACAVAWHETLEKKAFLANRRLSLI
jgi:hypothetical protein